MPEVSHYSFSPVDVSPQGLKPKPFFLHVGGTTEVVPFQNLTRGEIFGEV